MNPKDLHSISALDQANASEHLSERERHLVGLAVTLTRGCVYCSGGRIEKALAAGLSQETVTAAVDLTAAVNAGVVVRTALQALARHYTPPPPKGGMRGWGAEGYRPEISALFSDE